MLDASTRLACYDALAASIPQPSVSAPIRTTKPAIDPAPSVSTPTATSAASEFGLEGRKRPTQQTESIESTIEGRFDGWVARQRLRLTNGQVWEIADGSEAAYDLRDPKVKISRGFSGSFFMEVEGVAQTPRVRRLQ